MDSACLYLYVYLFAGIIKCSQTSTLCGAVVWWI